MSLEVRVTEQAHADIERNAHWWAENHSMEQAIRWQDAVYRPLRELALMQESYGIAHESAALGVELRQKVVGLGKGNYRAIFRIHERHISILAVRRATQDDITTELLDTDE
jgi:plasmid stabilization system protein ParE